MPRRQLGRNNEKGRGNALTTSPKIKGFLYWNSMIAIERKGSSFPVQPKEGETEQGGEAREDREKEGEIS